MPTNTYRHRVAYDAPRRVPVESSTVIRIGDICYLTLDGNVEPASMFTWDTDLQITQVAFARRFIGVAATRSRLGATTDVQVATQSVFEFPCDVTTFKCFALIGPTKASGNTLENQKVVKVDNADAAIFVTYRGYPDEVESIFVDCFLGRNVRLPATTTTSTTTASGEVCEYFLDFDETDPGEDIDIAAALITFTDIPNESVYRVSKSYGADHFDVGMIHDIQWKITSSSGYDPYAILWAIGNVESEYVEWWFFGAEVITIFAPVNEGAPTYSVFLSDMDEPTTDQSVSLDVGTQYYGTVTWVSATEIMLEIFSDAEKEMLLDTVSVALTPGTAYEFLYGFCNANFEDESTAISGTVGCLDINEEE